MFRKTKKVIESVLAILGWTGGGIHKRIDENRELVELLYRDGFIDRYPWVLGWLRSNDEFFSALLTTVPIQDGRFIQLTRGCEPFPRPWPKKIDNQTASPI